MTQHPQLSSACALLLLRNGDGISLTNTAKELASMQRQLTAETLDHNAIREDLIQLSKQMAGHGFELYVTDAPELTNDVGRVLP